MITNLMHWVLNIFCRLNAELKRRVRMDKELEIRIKHEVSLLTPEEIRKACNPGMRHRVEECLANGGHHSKHSRWMNLMNSSNLSEICMLSFLFTKPQLNLYLQLYSTAFISILLKKYLKLLFLCLVSAGTLRFNTIMYEILKLCGMFGLARRPPSLVVCPAGTHPQR